MMSSIQHNSRVTLGGPQGSHTRLATNPTNAGTSENKLKLLQKYEIIDSLVGGSREGASIKNSFLKMLLSRSVDAESSLAEAYDSTDLTNKLKRNMATL